VTAGKQFDRLLAVVRELRVKCPWDREQKLTDTTRHLIEEAYETIDAIGAGDRREIAEELGDLIVQSLFVAVILGEDSDHSIASILEGAAAKLVRRHPHVYADVKASSVDTVLENWDRIKQDEAGAKGKSKGLETTGRALPSLMRAEKLGEKARRRGMDWRDIRDVLAKVREELDEVEQALARDDHDAAADELGDLMLAMANAPRFLGRNAEETLRRAADKFVARFEAMERLAKTRGLNLKDVSPEQLDSMWQEIKRSR
jgi:MazG family protein